MTYSDIILLAIGGLIVYAWVVFPLLLGWVGRKPATKAAAVRKRGDLPRVAILLSAYNEENHIGERIRNLLELDYPDCHWHALIGVDGAHDRTAAEALTAAQEQDNISVLDFPRNRGKMAVLKDLVAAAGTDADVLVFTDANTVFERDAVRTLCRHFANPSIGGVCGKLALLAAPGVKTEEGVYWRLETWLKERESAIDSCLGANGAIYAIRRELFWSGIPSNTIVDDFVIAMKVREQNHRVVYEPAAIAYEDLPARVKDEWRRRVRIGAGDFQALQLCRACLSPSFGRFAWMFWSHKVLRWFTPHLMLAGCLLAAVVLLRSGGLLAAAVIAAAVAIALAASIGRVAETSRHPALRFFRAMAYFVSMQLALFAGFCRYFQGNLKGRWERTARE
jgi:cellulose synthase/poly-beta-1,6-N-acetylglucosamine synthase-like glycosyltransferase